ncbi:CaiB/BaiF CoA transferase family protein [Oceanobacillus damuensis]|uniref:CaiB/BaiF CoA transferase family protein n=1 Tax=Oceanobacillus damuensis TaxID=937928 RepID=UPI00083162F7|nr:CaiB/BaiF CoA-transferase family protein [Oceanobacillus damuensis]
MQSFQPLKGLQVIDITEGVAGPYAGQYLGDLGADVIKVERFEGDWGRTLGSLKYGFSTQYLALNRNKRNLSIDFKSEKGNKVVRRLLTKADIVITSFRPGVTEKYGLGYEDIVKENPNMLYGRISGYGYTGPIAHKTGVDTVIQANSGVMNYVGPPDGEPFRIGFAVIDQVAARDLVAGILSSYIEYLKTGNVEGPIDVSLFATAAALQSQQWQDYLETGKVPMRVGNKNPVIVPSAVYVTKDEKYLSVAAVRNDQFHRLCKVIGHEELVDDERFSSNNKRMKHRHLLEPILTETFLTKTRDEWEGILEENDILVAPVNTLESVYENKDLYNSIPKAVYKLNEVEKEIVSIAKPFVINNEYKSEAVIPPAYQGQHTDDILKELDFSNEEIMQMKEENIIRSAKEELTTNKG